MAKRVKDLQYYEAVGRRKEAVARVRLYIAEKAKPITVQGKKLTPGTVLINLEPMNAYFQREVDQKKFLSPLAITENLERFAISILVRGGGKSGQVEAIMHGLSRAITLADATFKPLLRQYDLLTRDPRARERRKVGMGGKARRKKSSPKR
jgi:small subunit ribosomal protein S9